MKNSKISIIVPVYNTEQYLEKCLDSLINQTYNNIEILLIDDGSKDNSGKICDEYAKKDKRIKVIHQKNSGVSRARNNGLDNFTGNYVMFVDSDDWIEPNTCEILLKKIILEKKDMVIYNFYKERKNICEKNKDYYCELENIPSNEIQAKILAPTLNIKGIKCNGLSLACNKIISGKIVKKHRFMFEGEKAIFEDGIFYYLLFENAINVGLSNDFLYHYRMLSTSATQAYNKSISHINNIIVDTIEHVRENHKNDLYYEESLSIRKLINLVYMLNVYINHKDSNQSLSKKIIQIKAEAKKPEYANIYNMINVKNLNKKLKLYHFLFKNNMYLLLIIANTIENKIKKSL